jgi:predicted aspartyl protease
VPVAIDEDGGIVVAVRIGDAGPFDFILDTGASRSIVADDLAQQLGAPLVARSEVVTSAGTELRGVVRLDAVSAAGARVESVIAPVVPAARLSALGASVRGILGQDFLSAFNYTLDYRRHHLTWDAGNPCGDPAAIRLMEAEGRFVMELPQPASRRPLRLVPDTGADALVLFDGHVENALVVPDGGVSLAGLTGNRSARQIVVSRLAVGPFTLRDRRAIVVERHDENADGLLPLHEFSSVSFAARGACVVVRN